MKIKLGVLKIKKITLQTSRNLEQEYKVMLFNVMHLDDRNAIDIPVEEERALFPNWKDEINNADGTTTIKEYKANTLYKNKVGDVVQGLIMSFTAIIDNSKMTLSCVVLKEDENPLKLIIRKINFFPAYLIDGFGKLYRIESKHNIPDWY